MTSELTKKKTALWPAPVGMFAGMAIAGLFRHHLTAEYFLIVGCLCAAAVAMVIFAIRHNRKQQQKDQSEFEQRLRQRRLIKAPTARNIPA